MFYAAGWSALDVEPQCTLIDYQSLSGHLRNVQSEIATWDPSSSQVVDLLRYHQILKSSAAAVEIKGTEESVFVSFNITLESNPRMCVHSFWRIKFVSKIYETKDLPQIERGIWISK